MVILCPLTEWESQPVARGKAKGKVVKSRLVAAADNWNWLVGLQRHDENSQVSGIAFVSSIRRLMLTLTKFEEEDKLALDNAIPRIVQALEKRTGKKLPTLKNFGPTELQRVGKLIDTACETIFCTYLGEPEYPAKLLSRIFKVDEADDSGGDDEETED